MGVAKNVLELVRQDGVEATPSGYRPGVSRGPHGVCAQPGGRERADGAEQQRPAIDGAVSSAVHKAGVGNVLGVSCLRLLVCLNSGQLAHDVSFGVGWWGDNGDAFLGTPTRLLSDSDCLDRPSTQRLARR